MCISICSMWDQVAIPQELDDDPVSHQVQFWVWGDPGWLHNNACVLRPFTPFAPGWIRLLLLDADLLQKEENIEWSMIINSRVISMMKHVLSISFNPELVTCRIFLNHISFLFKILDVTLPKRGCTMHSHSHPRPVLQGVSARAWLASGHVRIWRLSQELIRRCVSKALRTRKKLLNT